MCELFDIKRLNLSIQPLLSTDLWEKERLKDSTKRGCQEGNFKLLGSYAWLQLHSVHQSGWSQTVHHQCQHIGHAVVRPLVWAISALVSQDHTESSVMRCTYILFEVESKMLMVPYFDSRIQYRVVKWSCNLLGLRDVKFSRFKFRKRGRILPKRMWKNGRIRPLFGIRILKIWRQNPAKFGVKIFVFSLYTI
jgi:hypothetical protein